MNYKNQSRRDFIGASLATIVVGLAASKETVAQTTDSKTTQKIKTGTPDAPLKIAILLYDKMTALDAVGPYEVLSRMPHAKVYFVGESKGLKTADTKMLTLRADYDLTEIAKPDVLLIPGGDPREMMKSQAVLKWIREAHQSTTLTTSVCTGAMILGVAGLLKNLKATTHWATRELLKDFGAEYVPARWVEQGKIITAAGVSAGIDMALFVAEKLHGKDVAEMLQLAVEYDPQPPVDSGSLKKADQKTVDDALKYFAERRDS